MVTDMSNRLLATSGDQKMLEGKKAQNGIPKKWISVLAVLTVTIGLAYLAGPARPVQAQPRHAAITRIMDLDGGSDPVALVQNFFAAYGRGDFIGHGASVEAAKYIAQDMSFKSTRDFKNIDLWKPYTGVDGFVYMCQKEPTLYENIESNASISPGAPGSGEVMMMMKWRLAVKSTGKSNSKLFNDFIFITVKDGKISSMEYYPERGDELDGLFVKEDPVALVQNMFAAWGNGDFNGQSASVEAAKYFAQDMSFKSTCDFKNTDIWKPYSGVDGFVSWCKKQPTVFEIKELTPSIYPGAPGSGEVMMMLKTKIAAKNTGKTNSKIFNDFTVVTVKDGKISSMEYYPERGDELDGLFVAN